MEGFNLIKQGAEAKLYEGTYLGRRCIAKERFVKGYRHVDLDSHLTKERIKAESRSIVRCKAVGIRTPTLYLVDLSRRIIFMEYFVNSITLKQFIEECLNEDILIKLALHVGKTIGKMHDSNIIHGDLTSSNILIINITEHGCILADKLELALIDFGLSHIDNSSEDKGVDLYVLERALLSTHASGAKMFVGILEGYKKQNQNSSNSKEVMDKFEEVRARGRKRTMVG